MKNICFFSGDITRSGGTERVTSQISSALSDRNQYSVTIISLIETAKIPYYDLPDDIQREVLLSKPIEPIRKAIYRFPLILHRLVRSIKRNQIDIIVDVDGILDIFSLPAKLFTKVRVITWEHFNYYTDLDNKLRFYLKKFSARFSDSIIVLTEEDKGYYEKNLKLKCPIEFIYNPITMCDEASYNADSKNIISAGRLNTQKGFDLLIEVAKKVFEKHNDWAWTIAGEGEERGALETKIAEYGLTEHIHLIGNVKNIGDYYADAGIFVLTSRFEGFGLVIVEARKHRLPVVSFTCKAGPSELVSDEHNGFLIPCFDIAAMAQKINQLIEDRELRIRFSNHAHDDTYKLGYPAVMQKWEEVLERVVAR